MAANLNKGEEMNNQSSWRTSLAGLAAIMVAVGAAVKAFTDNDPLTVPDIGACVAAVIAGIGLILARDNKSAQ
jgi:hypothetical protein